MRYIFPHRLTFKGDHAVASKYVGEARALLGDLVRDLGEANIRSGKRQRRYSEALIEVTYDGTLARVLIDTSVALTLPPASDRGAMWVPRGFVLYPASDAAPHGWGLPVVQLTMEGSTLLTPYDTPNIDPGLDVSRWTVGGSLGQVLLTKVPGAGYPTETELLAPAEFSRSYGPRLSRGQKLVTAETLGAYAAFRLRLTGFKDPQSPTQNASEAAAMVAFKRGVFERVNAHRVSIGRDPVDMPLFGFYDSAQITAEILYQSHTLGHFSDRYPSSYRTAEDRLTKDGLRSINVAYANPDSRNENTGENTVVRAYVEPVQIGTDPNGVGIFDVSSGGPDINAQQAYDGWIASPPHKAMLENAAFDQAGMTGATTTIGQRHNYGVEHFMRVDGWLSCGNRVFECPDGLSPISWFGPPSLNLAWETFPCAIISNNTDAPLSPLYSAFGFNNDTTSVTQYYMTDRDTDYRFGWSRAVYSAGRCIAYAPGLVWAAGVHRLGGGKYRLVVLTHNNADQPVDVTTNGMTRNLRYYYCDMEAAGGALLSPGSMIRGLYGHENEGWPWDEVNFAFSWRGGTLVDVGTLFGDEADLLKYKSQWVFNSDATSAVCLRDYGPLKGVEPSRRGYATYPYLSSGVGSFSDGLFPATVQLNFMHSPDNVTHSLSYKTPVTSTAVEQIAVDFDAAGELIYAYRAFAQSFSGIAGNNFSDPLRFRLSFVSLNSYYCVGIGPYGLTEVEQLQHSARLPESEPGVTPYMWYNVHVLDVNGAVFIGERPPASNCFIQTGDNPAISVELIVDGDRKPPELIANPTDIWLQARMCFIGALAWTTNYAVSGVVQGYYARRGNDYIAGFTVVPQPNMLRAVTPFPSAGDRCSTFGGGTCMPTVLDYYAYGRFTTPDDLTSLGHYTTASFALLSELQEMVGAEGAGFRSIYARVV